MANTELHKCCEHIKPAQTTVSTEPGKRKMNVKIYIDQFNVLGIDEYINCDTISQMLYHN